jgi:hypothetical protein
MAQPPANLALDPGAPSFITACSDQPPRRQSLSGQKRSSIDGEDAAPSSRQNLPPSGRHRRASHSSPQPTSSTRPGSQAPAPSRRVSRSPEGREEHHSTRRAGKGLPALMLLNTAPRRSSSVEGARQLGGLCKLASSCVEAEGCSAISLPGPASDQCSWVEFARVIKPAHAAALMQALEFFHKPRR